MKRTNIRLAIYLTRYDNGPMACVRFTEFNDEGKIEKVSELKYANKIEEAIWFDLDTTNALEEGMDVCIYTNRSVNKFPLLSEYT